MLEHLDPSPEQARDIAAEDAHALLRSNLLPLILRRADAPAILRNVANGTELRLDFLPALRLIEAVLVGRKPVAIMLASLADDPAMADLADVCGLALVAALNVEATERRHELARVVNESGTQYVVRLRVLAGIETLSLMLLREGRALWRVERAVPFDPADCLTPSADTLKH